MLSSNVLNTVRILSIHGIGLSVNGTFTYVGRLGNVSNSKVILSPKDLMSYSAGIIFSREIFIHLISSYIFNIVLVVSMGSLMALGEAPLGEA